jgi:hypothetical protein
LDSIVRFGFFSRTSQHTIECCVMSTLKILYQKYRNFLFG